MAFLYLCAKGIDMTFGEVIETCESAFHLIGSDRKEELNELAKLITKDIDSNGLCRCNLYLYT